MKLFHFLLKFSLFIACAAILILAISSITTTKNGNPGSLSGYPAPVQDQTQSIDIDYQGYPYPSTPTSNPTQTPPTSIVKENPTSTPYKTATFEPWVATNIASKVINTPSTERMTEVATQMAYRSQISTPSIKPTVSWISFSSENDLPNVVYKDPFYSRSSFDFSQCIQAKTTGKPSLVKSLENSEWFYILPFYQNSKICGLAKIITNNNLGRVDEWVEGNNLGVTYPSISASEAINLVFSKTGKKVSSQPLLVSGDFKEIAITFSTMWQVNTDDGEAYYVFFPVALPDNENIEKSVIIFNSNEMHKIN